VTLNLHPSPRVDSGMLLVMLTVCLHQLSPPASGEHANSDQRLPNKLRNEGVVSGNVPTAYKQNVLQKERDKWHIINSLCKAYQ
jgi:hypothetical protein